MTGIGQDFQLSSKTRRPGRSRDETVVRFPSSVSGDTRPGRCGNGRRHPNGRGRHPNGRGSTGGQGVLERAGA